MRNQTHRATIVAIVVFIFVPFVLAMVGAFGGVSGTEKRSATEFPAIWNAPFSSNTWTDMDSWFGDRTAFRSSAIEAERELRRRFDDRRFQSVEKNDQVIAGGDPDWLFFTPATSQACISPEQEAIWVAEIQRVEGLLNSIDKRLVVGIAPDRGIVVPNRLGEAENQCQRSNTIVIERLSALDAVENLVESVNTDDDVLRTDTHWSPTGAFAAAEQMVNAIDPKAWAPTSVRSEDWDIIGDLSKLVASDEQEATRIVRFDEDSASTVDELELGLRRATTPNASPLSVLLAHDSFGGTAQTQEGSSSSYMRPWFSRFDNFRVPGSTATPLALEPVKASLVNAQVVAFLFVQRTLPSRFSPTKLSGPLIVALQDELLLVPLAVASQGERSTVEVRGTTVLLHFDELDSEGVTIAADSGAIEGRFDLGTQTVIVAEPGTTLVFDREPSQAAALD